MSDSAGTETSPAEEAVALAEKLLVDSLDCETRQERMEMRRMENLIEDEALKRHTIRMTDLFWRTDLVVRLAAAWRDLLRLLGSPFERFSVDRFLLRLGGFGSLFLPKLVVTQVRKRLKRESARVILPAEDPAFAQYVEARKEASVNLNINQLGEAVLGDEEAGRRLKRLLELLERPDVNYVSVKLSAIDSQLNILAWDDTLTKLKDRLRQLYRSAKEKEKFVNLDMEEYDDLELTVEAFQEVLDEPEFLEFSAGIVLQAYLPDSIGYQEKLIAWARERCGRGGVPVKIRLVKGANLAMEKVDAEWNDWALACHSCKEDTDAAFKRMLEFGCQSENAEVARLGVGSHNLFDVGLAIILSRRNGVEDKVDIEMLEGMADAQSRAVVAETGRILLYAPIVKAEGFGSALAYLVRRLDENTAPGNFLTDLFAMKPDSERWEDQKQRFLSAWDHRRSVDPSPRRRNARESKGNGFTNEPDSDWTDPENRRRVSAAWEGRVEVKLPDSHSAEEIGSILETAVAVQPDWERRGGEGRAAILRKCAEVLAEERFETLAAMRADAKKAVDEGDAEVSEAIDFCRYYAQFAEPPGGVVAEALGVVVVTPPWNFPYAIPCGGVIAALAAGNSVILKPSREARETGFHLADQLWKAGVPRDVLQCIICEDGEAGKVLITDPRTSAVILTGSSDTAAMFREWRPSLPLFAETSGKNAIVVSALADRELAVKDLVRSAFSHSGQKCSAASLGILEAEVYDDPIFRRQLLDATASLPVGPADHLPSVVTPVIRKPDEKLLRALATLDEGEEWLLEPKVDENDPCLWTPGIRLGVKPGSWFHQTECFGPVLGLMRAETLPEAVAMQNGVAFGLTAGFQSLDPTEIAWWKEEVKAGNLYINRGITGAIVQRQPFGGWKASSVGPGAKAGGPNYVNLFRKLKDEVELSSEASRHQYEEAWRSQFGIEHDPTGLACESNDFRYRPRIGVLLRLPARNERVEALARLAAERCGVPLEINHASKESTEKLIARIETGRLKCSLLRTTGGEEEEDLILAASRQGINWLDAPISCMGNVELPRWMHEQAVSETRHRYGNILRRD